MSVSDTLIKDTGWVDRDLNRLLALERAYEQTSLVIDDLHKGVSLENATCRLELIKTIDSGINYSLEADNSRSGLVERAKEIAAQIAKAIKELIERIYRFITGTRNTVRIRRLQLQSGFEALEERLKTLTKDRGRLRSKKEFIRNTLIYGTLSVNGRVDINSLISSYTQLSLMLREYSSIASQRANINNSIIERLDQISNVEELTSLMKPEPKMSACSTALPKSEFERLGLKEFNVAYRSSDLPGNKMLYHADLVSSARQSDISSISADVKAVPWVSNKHGHYLDKIDPSINMEQEAMRAFAILTDTELNTAIRLVKELLRQLHILEGDLTSLQNSLKQAGRKSNTVERSESFNSAMAQITRSYLLGSYSNTLRTYTQLYTLSLSVVQQTLSWIRASIKVYERS